MKKEKLLAIGLACMLLAIGFTNVAVAAEENEELSSDLTSEERVLERGILDDPIMIEDVSDLQDMNQNLTANYALANDIDASETSEWNWNETEGVYRGFEPIGDGEYQFEGTFDGRGYTITGLFINRPDTSGVGLFSHMDEGGSISDVSLVDIDVTGNSYVGGLVGRSGGFHTPGGTVSNSSASGVLTGLGFRVGGLMGWNSFAMVSNSYADVLVTADNTGGGLMGQNEEGIVSNCFSIGNVSGEGNSLAGLVGRNRGVIEYSYATGHVNGSSYLGGLVGYNAGGSISYSYATGSIDSTIGESSQAIGGLAGINSGYVNYSYATGDVTGPFRRVGGLVGQNTGAVTDSYATGNVTGGGTGETWEGGLVGDNGDGDVIDSFYDQETTGHSDTGKGEPKTTVEMMTETTFTDAGWDLADTWWMIDGETRPFLRSEWSSEIRNSHQLQLMAMDLSADYELVSDVDLSDITNPSQMWGTSPEGGSGFVPVGDNDTPFTGSFDGYNNTITGLYINRPNTNYVGLFGVTGDECTVKDVNMLDVEITGDEYVGALVGENQEGSSLFNNHACGILNGGYRAGGLVGRNGGTLYRSSSYVEVNSGSDTGGLVGIVRPSGVVENSYATGNVDGNSYVGGLVGLNNGLLNNSYATGNVSGSGRVGGLVGDHRGTTDNSYSTGLVTGTSDVGGLIGINSGSVLNSFWDNQTSGQTNSDGGIGRDTDEMMTQSTFTDAGWDFDNIWWMLDGMTYPLLYWQERPTGEGTPEDPYLIYDVYDLQDMRDDVTAHYMIVNDIDASETETWNDGAGFIPIGTNEERFNGSLDGQGHEITGLYIDHAAEYNGLFGVTDEAEIMDVGLLDVEIQGDEYTGGLVGYAHHSIVSRSYVTGIVSGGNPGGLIGRTWMGSVEHSYADVDVDGSTWVGGLIGFNDVCTVSDSYARGDVYGSHMVGGLIGRNDRAAVEYSYSTGTVSGDSNVGGLVGGGSTSGGFADIANFWDNQTSGQTESWMGTGMNTTEMKTQTTFTDETWDFTDTWWMIENATYPLLWYQPVAVGITSPYHGESFAISEVTVEWLGGTNGSGAVNYSIRINGGEWIDKEENITHQFTDLEEGEHIVDVKAYDTDNNSAVDTVMFIVDLTEPHVEITSPSDGEAFSSTNVTVEWTGSGDPSGIDYYEIRINQEGWINKERNTSHNFTYLDEGEHTVYVRATDNAGNNATSNVTFTVDVTPPNVTITSPDEGEIFNVSDITVLWDGSDDETGISHYEIRLNEEEWIDVGMDTEYIFEGLSDGEHTVYVRAFDHANNSAEDNVTFIVDVTDPTIEITSPDHGEIFNVSDVTVQWTGSDDVSGIDYYEIRLDEDEWTNIGLNTSHQFTELEEGDHTVDVRVTDKAGNDNSDSVTFTVDVTPPTVTITSPDHGEIFNVSDVTVQWTGSDQETGISHYEIRLNDEDWINVGNDTEYILEELIDDEHTVYVRAFDFANNTDTDHVNFTVDVTPPSVDIISPSEEEVIPSVNVTVEWTGSDDTSGIDHYEIRIDGDEWINKGLQTSHEFMELDEGEHTVDIRATDNASNSAVDSVTFIVDVSDPTVNITSPDEGDMFGTSEVTVEWEGGDDISGVEYYEIRINESDWIYKGLDESHLFTDLTDGFHFVEVIAYDHAGNFATDNVTFMVDVTPPTVDITSPEDDDVISDPEVVVEWTGHDDLSGIDYYEIRIDEGVWIDKGNDTYHEFTELAEGEQVVDVRAYDNAGNLATDTVTFTIEFEISYIVISPNFEAITAGDTIEYTAMAYDEFDGEKGDVTHETTWSIEDGAGGHWDDNVYHSEFADDWTVTGVYDGMEDTATLRVLAGDVHSIVISPEDETITAGDHVDYVAFAYDEFGNEKGEISATYSIDDEAGGSWSNRRYHSEFAGTWTVTGTYDGVQGTATLNVEPGHPFDIVISPEDATIVVGESQTYTASASDEFGNDIGDVTQDVTWSIDHDAGGFWTDNVYTSEDPGTWQIRAEGEYHTGYTTLTVESDVIEYALDIMAGNGGTTDPVPGNHIYEEGDTVNIEALPDPGWTFSHWTGDHPAGERENPVITLTMDEHKAVTANFIETGFEPGNLLLDVYPDSGEAPLEVTIYVYADNFGEEPGSIDVFVDDRVEYTLEVPAGGDAEHTFTHTFEEPGIYEIEFHGLRQTVNLGDVAEFEPENIELFIEQLYGEAPLETSIYVLAENFGELDGSIDVIINGRIVYTLHVPANDIAEHEFTHIFEEVGTYSVEFYDETRFVEVYDPESFAPVNLELDVDPISGEPPLTADIYVSAENVGEEHGYIDVLIDGTVVYTLDLPTQSSADHSFQHTFDNVGEYLIEFRHLSETVTVSVEPLTIEITSPADGEVFDMKDVTVSWSSEGAISHHEISINDGPWYDIGLMEHYTFPDLEDGDHTVQVKVVSSTGDEEIISLNFTVDTEEEESTELPIWALALIGILVIALIAVFVSIAVVMRKGKEKPSPESNERYEEKEEVKI